MSSHTPLIRLAMVAAIVCWGGLVQGQILTAFQVNHRCDRPVGQEGNAAIMAAKTAFMNAGSMVYVYWRNRGDAPRQLKTLRWNGADYDHWYSADGDYQAIWRAARPEKVAAGAVGEIALCLRSALTTSTAFELEFDDGSRETVQVPPQDAPARFATIAFSADLRQARCFIEEQGAGRAVGNVIVDGKQATVAWWSNEAVHGLRVADLTFAQPLRPGERLVFLALDSHGAALTGASLRAFSELATFGTYGFGELRRYAENGLDSFNSFAKVPKGSLDSAEALHMRVVTGTYVPDVETAGHPAIYAYLLCDEPDCRDFGQWAKRPIHRRLGGCAPEMLRYYDSVAKGDPRKPSLLTIDLTFTPYNYFIYGPLADISNPDIYTNTCGWSVKYIDHHLSMVKRATAPRPFSFTYQSCWEEWSKPQGRWVGRQELLEKGFEVFRDKDRKPRGFGYNTNPDEMAIAMHYALLNGATALFAYTDSSETGSNLLFHGTDVLPENWAAVGRFSRKLARIGSLLYPAHPVTMATATGKVQIGTLLADREHLLVVAVNENYSRDKAFAIVESDTAITLPLPPWQDGGSVLRVGYDGFEPVEVQREGRQLRWNAKVRNGEIYLVSSSAEAAQRVVAAAVERERKLRDGLSAEQNAQQAYQSRLKLMRESGEAIWGTPIHGYWVKADEYAPTTDGSYNAMESWEKSGTTVMGATWNIGVTEAQTGHVHDMLWEGRIYGATAKITLTAPDGSVVFERNTDLSVSAGQIWSFTPKMAGTYTLRSVATPAAAVEHGNRIVRRLFRVVK